MAPEAEPNSNPEPAEAIQSREGARQGRRSSRGRRGRGRRHKPRMIPGAVGQTQQQGPAAPEELRQEESPFPQEEPSPIEAVPPAPEPALPLVEPTPPEEEAPVAARPIPVAPPVAETELPEPPATLQDAIEHVDRIVTTLRESLEEMEEVLELLETLERQTSLDQREIDSLRRALRQLHRPRDSGREHSRETGHHQR